MALRGTALDTAPDALALLARLRALPGACALITAEPPHPALPWRSFVAAAPAATSHALCPEGAVHGGEDDAAWGFAPRWVGLLPYELARGLERRDWAPEERRAPPHHVAPTWARYDAVLVVDHRRGEVFAVGDDAPLVREIAHLANAPRPPAKPCRARLVDDGGIDAHADRIREVLRLVAQGDLYQVNIARRVLMSVESDAFATFEKLLKASPATHGSYIEWPGLPVVCSTSPEVFLEASPRGLVRTVPIKGTRPRGRDAEGDLRQRLELDADPKERAELAMVVDLERNDLGRLAVPGSVRLVAPPRVVTHRTLHHRKADVVATLPLGTSWEHLLRATFPSGSVTGAPKVRAMEVIASLEPARRGLYTGAIGYVARGGALSLAMAIRTLTVRDGEGHYHVGGGIVWGSDPAREVEETRVKALQLESVLRG